MSSWFFLTRFATKIHTYINRVNNLANSWDVFLRLQYTFQLSSLHTALQNTMSQEFLKRHLFRDVQIIVANPVLTYSHTYTTLMMLWHLKGNSTLEWGAQLNMYGILPYIDDFFGFRIQHNGIICNWTWHKAEG